MTYKDQPGIPVRSPSESNPVALDINKALGDIRADLDLVLVRLREILALLEENTSKEVRSTHSSSSTHPRTREGLEIRKIAQAISESRIQVILGLVAGFVALAVAIYLFARPR